MSKTITTTNGEFLYRTKPMASAQAISFHRMLCNNRNFEAVSLSELTKTGKQSVYFRPVGRTAQENLYGAENDKRVLRAHEEAEEYIYWPDTDTGGYWCFNPLSGQTYKVTAFDCDCPDFQFRANRAGLLCKHQIGLDLQVKAGMIGQTDKKTPLVTPSGAVCNVDLDFP